MIFSDQTFCYAVTAGSLDLLAVGKWSMTPRGIELQEQKKASAGMVVLFRPWSSSAGRMPRGELVFEFDGISLGDQGSFAFGTSDDDAMPKTMRPLFSDKANEFSENYTEKRSVGRTRSFYLAYRVHQKRTREDDPGYHVFEYRLPTSTNGEGATIRIGFDKQTADPPIDVIGTIEHGEFMVRGQSFGKPDLIKEKPTVCSQKLEQVQTGEPDPPLSNGAQRLEPIRFFDQDLHFMAQTAPLFKTPPDVAKKSK